jgi:hypothetical protein
MTTSIRLSTLNARAPMLITDLAPIDLLQCIGRLHPHAGPESERGPTRPASDAQHERQRACSTGDAQRCLQ